MKTQTNPYGLVTLRKPQLEVAISAPSSLSSFASETIEKKLDFGANVLNYPTHLRIVQVQEIETHIQVMLIRSQNTCGKEATRKIYEQGFNWENWLQSIQENVQKPERSLTGYHLINYVTHEERYLGQSWSEVCEHLAEVGYNSH